VAALFHDVAKGRGGDHSDLGAQRGAALLPRPRHCARQDARLIEFLVAAPPDDDAASRRRRTSRTPTVVPAFAQLVGNERRLTALYLLTVADIRGTSPKVWNAWKGKLLEDLYRLTLRALGGAQPNVDAEVEARKQEARQLLDLHSALPGTEEPLWKTLEVSYFAPPRCRRYRLARALAGGAPAHHARPWCRRGCPPWARDCRCWCIRPTSPTSSPRICGYFDSRPASASWMRKHPHHARGLRAGHLPDRAARAGLRAPTVPHRSSRWWRRRRRRPWPRRARCPSPAAAACRGACAPSR
jgi:[protein-PII] uridylyltransferase